MRGVGVQLLLRDAAMIARSVRLQRPQSPPAPHAAATSLDVDAPLRDDIGHGLIGGPDTQAYVHQHTPPRRVVAAQATY